MRVRILTFNVWNTEGDPQRLRLINRKLRELQPDLMALQEVVQTPQKKSLDGLLEGLALHTTHQADIQKTVPPFSDRYGGSAIATRWEHRAVEALDLRVAGAADVPWATLDAVVKIPGAGEMLFVAATAAWRRYLTGRQSLQGRSVLYHDAWAVAGEGPGYTWSSDNPNARGVIDQIVRQPVYRNRFDYVLVGSWDAHPKAHAHVRFAALAFDQPIEGVWVSDHFGLLVELDVGMDG